MNRYSSGCYVIDKDFNVVSVNHTAKVLYPDLKTGEKCYRMLMGDDKPCAVCPVVNGKKGPHTYVDPIRGILETVDAVEIDDPEHGKCYALIFSTVDREADLISTLPTTEEGLRNLSLIKALTIDYIDVFAINLTDRTMRMYRHDGKALAVHSIYNDLMSYDEGIESYISRFVVEDERERMRKECSPEHIMETLKSSESMAIHYRVLLKNEIHHYVRKIVRIGEADNFENVVVGIACEDEEIRQQQRRKSLEKNLIEVEYDSLTNLYTKEAFFLHSERIRRQYPEVKFDFCILKIENLGLINHQYGHLAGDKIMELVSRELKKFTEDTTCLAYMGGSTFASITETASRDIRKKSIEDFRDRILKQSEIKNISLKWSLYKELDRDLSVEEIYEKTNFALSTIRASMHQDYVEFDQGMFERMEWEEAVDHGFESALLNGEFVPWYQPKYDAKTRKIIGAEALVRWVLPTGDMIPPDHFIPILERCGKIGQLDMHMFEKVCEIQAKLKAMQLPQIPISVNLSRASMLAEHVAEEYADIAGKYGIPTSLIPIEITESAAVRAIAIGTFADELLEKGFSLHMDDFGSGYSSLASLQIIPFDCIKIDKSLVDFIGEKNGENLLKHAIALAKESGKNVIAEGVENMEQYLFLKVIGCDEIQGYYFSKPVPEKEFIRLLKK